MTMRTTRHMANSFHCWSLLVRSHCVTIQMNTLRQNFHFVLTTFFSLSNFWVCGPNSVVWPFKWKLFGNTFTWYYLVFSSLRLYFFWILILAHHAIEPKGWISDKKTPQTMVWKPLHKDGWMKQKQTKQDGKDSSHLSIFTRFRRNSPFWSLRMFFGFTVISPSNHFATNEEVDSSPKNNSELIDTV